MHTPYSEDPSELDLVAPWGSCIHRDSTETYYERGLTPKQRDELDDHLRREAKLYTQAQVTSLINHHLKAIEDARKEAWDEGFSEGYDQGNSDGYSLAVDRLC